MEIEGFIKLPIKVMIQKSFEEIEKAYEKYQEDLEYYESLGITADVKEPEIDEEKYTKIIHCYVRPEAISAFKPAEDGNVDITIDSVLDYSRIFMKFEEFVELLKSTK